MNVPGTGIGTRTERKTKIEIVDDHVRETERNAPDLRTGSGADRVTRIVEGVGPL